MKTEFLVRVASIDDAFEITKLVVLTINQGCFLDHNDDFIIIDKWVENKTVTNFIDWINDSSLYLNVVLSDGRISGIGMCDSGSHI